jgi:hypothetical protein
MMDINEDNKVFIFIFYKLPNVTLFSSSMTYPHITFKNLTCMVQDAYALSANVNKWWLRIKTIKQ